VGVGVFEVNDQKLQGKSLRKHKIKNQNSDFFDLIILTLVRRLLFTVYF